MCLNLICKSLQGFLNKIFCLFLTYGPVVQRIERSTSNRVVAGSIPAGITNKFIFMEINQLTLYKLITSYSPYSKTNKVIDDFQVVQSTLLTSSDDEDGGGHYDVIIKKISTSQFFKATYCDWDINNTDYDEEADEEDEDSFESDLDNDLVEVFPEEVTVTVYKPKK